MIGVLVAIVEFVLKLMGKSKPQPVQEGEQLGSETTKADMGARAAKVEAAMAQAEAQDGADAAQDRLAKGSF